MTTTNQDTIRFDEVTIIDDGTLDTVVKYEGQEYRYSSEFRNSFDDDDEFLREALDDILNYNWFSKIYRRK